MKIAFEGMDGVGKTAVSKAIAQLHGYEYIEKPLHYLFEGSNNDGYEVLGEVSSKLYKIDDPVIKAWFFGLGNLFAYRQFQDKNLVIDRHFASNYFWNGTKESNIVFKTMLDIIGAPDLTILLYASVETRMKRLYKRNPNDWDCFDPEKKVDGYDKMIAFLEEFNISYVLVDTENKTIDEVIDIVNAIVVEKQAENKILKLERK